MPKKSDIWETSESGNWNVAADYVKLKIMKPLYDADGYEKSAIFGDPFDEPGIYKSVNENKIEGFERLVQTLILVINTTLFAVKRDKKDLEEYKGVLVKINKIIPKLYFFRTNHIKKTKMMVIDEDKYKILLDKVSEVKSLINEPLNQADLIFTHIEDFDMKKVKEEIKKGLKNVG